MTPLSMSQTAGADSGDGFLEELVEWDGAELSQRYCITCHQYPDTNLLPKDSWPYVLDLMGLYFGYDDGNMLSSTSSVASSGAAFDVGQFPSDPTLSPFQWAAIRDYYEAANGAEAVAEPPEANPFEYFDTKLVFEYEGTPVISMVAVAPEGRGFYLGDATNSRLLKFDVTGELVSSESMPGAVVQITFGEGFELATSIGKMRPSDEATGSVLERKTDTNEWRTVIEDLRRPVFTTAADLDGDGQLEILVNQFGHNDGELSLFDVQDASPRSKRVLHKGAGSIGSQVIDLERRGGLPGILVLNAQAKEELLYLRNEGELEFQVEVLLQKPPSFGFTQLLVADLTGDGIEEIVTVNGDNADLPGTPLKAYHGVRIYQFGERGNLVERRFLHMPGAFQATLADFNGDQLLDIAAVSFFPDSRAAEQGFVLFENLGDLSFNRLASPVGAIAPWMTIGSGDLDGDGDIDIVLGTGYVREKDSESDVRPAAAILTNRLSD